MGIRGADLFPLRSCLSVLGGSKGEMQQLHVYCLLACEQGVDVNVDVDVYTSF